MVKLLNLLTSLFAMAIGRIYYDVSRRLTLRSAAPPPCWMASEKSDSRCLLL